MKRPLRRLGTAVIVMIGLLLANIAYTQVIKADDYRADPNNKRTLVAEYSRQRGQITAARSVNVDRATNVGNLIGNNLGDPADGFTLLTGIAVTGVAVSRDGGTVIATGVGGDTVAQSGLYPLDPASGASSPTRSTS